ncbi:MULTISPECIES: cbb3-type cytochrome c oxidase subunit I [Calditerrivibrio]|uniref:Cytochrome oxidase subunit I profile domain-containing protein n=1 Tax=Calditerrivibrio nitroreducens TaxID=477976 RepID=A0A2J6WNJ7_9BACT|nr:MAG: hypothetical protein C0187_02835 [Calditerrivibrio nitroreducens]
MSSEFKSYLEDNRFQSKIKSWLLTTDHKKIGLLYLYSTLTLFLVGVLIGLLIRIELFNPGQDIVGPQTYNALFTLHGVIMIFLFVIPGIPASLGNFFLPIMIGAEDVSFPRLNLFFWYLYIISIQSLLILKVTPFWKLSGQWFPH